jgi:hypothetical protein
MNYKRLLQSLYGACSRGGRGQLDVQSMAASVVDPVQTNKLVNLK